MPKKPCQIVSKMNYIVCKFSVLLVAISFFCNPLSLDAGQKKSGKSKNSGTSLVKKKSSAVKSKGAKKKKTSKSKSPSHAPASSPSSSATASLTPTVEQLLQYILTNVEIYKADLAVSDAAFSELQSVLREFGTEEIIETLKSDQDTEPFITALKLKNPATSNNLIFELNNLLSDKNLNIDNFIYSALPTATISTLAGSGVSGYADSTGANSSMSAMFNNPTGVAVDKNGNVYVADSGNHRIRKITPEGAVSTLAGSGGAGFQDGIGVDAGFYQPTGLTVDKNSNVYVADSSNHRIRKITPSGVVSTLAGSGIVFYEDTDRPYTSDGVGTAASFYHPTGVAADVSGNIYVADNYGNKIRKILPSGLVKTLAGSGYWGSMDGIVGSFRSPAGVAADIIGNVYVADSGNSLIRKISVTGNVATLAGFWIPGFADGTGTDACFNYPFAVVVNSVGSLYVADCGNNRIRKITPEGVVSTIAGSGQMNYADGEKLNAHFNGPAGIAVDAYGNIYIADSGNNRIRKITFSRPGLSNQ